MFELAIKEEKANPFIQSKLFVYYFELIKGFLFVGLNFFLSSFVALFEAWSSRWDFSVGF
jgi:hypothetical protein